MYDCDSIEYVYGAKSSNEMYCVIKTKNMQGVRATLVNNGMDFIGYLDESVAREKCFHLVDRIGWKWMTSDDFASLLGGFVIEPLYDGRRKKRWMNIARNTILVATVGIMMFVSHKRCR